MMRQADRNGNGRLESDEWNERWGDFREADRNHDGAVTADELAQRLSGFARWGPGGDRGGPDGSAGPERAGTGSGSPERAGTGSGSPERPKSYRLPTPTEILPQGLPDWFAQKDSNADGQVAMAEFESAGAWTRAAVAEFVRLDLNNDGIITPGECLKALNRADAGGQIASAEAPPQAPEMSPAGPPRGPGPENRQMGPFSREDQGRSASAARGRGPQSNARGGAPGFRGRGSQSSSRETSGRSSGGGVGDAWEGFQ
jgi:hypothetical protein